MRFLRVSLAILLLVCMFCSCGNKRPFNTLTYPDSVRFEPMLSSVLRITSDESAIKSFVDMLNACEYNRIESEMTAEEIKSLVYVDLVDVDFYLDVDHACLYLCEYERGVYPTPTEAYEISGFDEPVFNAFYETIIE